jgi:predicted nucleic acid-binding protein
VISKNVLLDSSVWIEILSDGPLVEACKKELAASTVIVPTVVIYEVYKKITSSTSEDRGLSAIALLSQYMVTDLSSEIALHAADLSLLHKLGMADSLVLAHAQQSHAKLVTLDNDFAKIENVQVIRRS